MRLPRIALLMMCVALLTGCVTSVLARKLVSPPNRSGIRAMFADTPLVQNAPRAFAEIWKVRTAAPAADLVIASIEPGDYGFTYDLRLAYGERGPRIESLRASWKSASEATPRNAPPKGTLLFLHGYLQDKRFLTPWAIRLAQEGYRCVVLDLRGHGESTGRHIAFGAFEAADVSAVIDDLARRGWDVSRVGLFGVSYGASIALLAAGRDTRVKAVVAFEPFASAEKAVPELMRAAFTAQSRGISDRQFSVAHRKQAELAGFDWADADIPAALARTQAPVLFFHGEADTWLSPGHSRELARHAPPGSELRLVPRDDHVTLPMQIATFDRDVIRWFDAALFDGAMARR